VAAVDSVVYWGLVFSDASRPCFLNFRGHEFSEVVDVQDGIAPSHRIVQFALQCCRETRRHIIGEAPLADFASVDYADLRARFPSVFETQLALKGVASHLDQWF